VARKRRKRTSQIKKGRHRSQRERLRRQSWNVDLRRVLTGVLPPGGYFWGDCSKGKKKKRGNLVTTMGRGPEHSPLECISSRRRPSFCECDVRRETNEGIKNQEKRMNKRKTRKKQREEEEMSERCSPPGSSQHRGRSKTRSDFERRRCSKVHVPKIKCSKKKLGWERFRGLFLCSHFPQKTLPHRGEETS